MSYTPVYQWIMTARGFSVPGMQLLHPLLLKRCSYVIRSCLPNDYDCTRNFPAIPSHKFDSGSKGRWKVAFPWLSGGYPRVSLPDSARGKSETLPNGNLELEN